MSAILSWIIQNIALPLLLMIFDAEKSKIVAWFDGLLSKQKQKETDKANVAALKAAAQSGDHDALADMETHVLDGDPPSDHS